MNCLTLLTNSISEHQLPLAREIFRQMGPRFRYVYTGERQGGGQEVDSSEPWIVRLTADASQSESILVTPDVLLSGNRVVDVFERRAASRKLTLYMSERWFKPLAVSVFGMTLVLPGWLRLAVPSYFRMARRLVRLFSTGRFLYLPVGPWAAKDMRIVFRVAGVGLRSLHGLDVQTHFIPWGYYVAPAVGHVRRAQVESSVRRILWVGRMLDWKRVDSLIRAVRASECGNGSVVYRQLTLTLVGDGPERRSLERLAKGISNITFRPPVPISEVRELMRSHDVYVLASNAREGWGAALNEALEEGMLAIGTDEAGASAALLPSDHRFPAGDWRRLAALLRGHIEPIPMPASYTAQGGARKLMDAIMEREEYSDESTR